jgi:hypothetical protein
MRRLRTFLYCEEVERIAPPSHHTVRLRFILPIGAAAAPSVTHGLCRPPLYPETAPMRANLLPFVPRPGLRCAQRVASHTPPHLLARTPHPFQSYAFSAFIHLLFQQMMDMMTHQALFLLRCHAHHRHATCDNKRRVWELALPAQLAETTTMFVHVFYLR